MFQRLWVNLDFREAISDSRGFGTVLSGKAVSCTLHFFASWVRGPGCRVLLIMSYVSNKI